MNAGFLGRSLPISWRVVRALTFPALLVGSLGAATVVNLREAGAVGDGVTVNTAAIQSGIDRCSASGGGRVVLPMGRFVSGTLRLRDKVTLHLDAGAVLLGSTRPSDYRNYDRFLSGDGAFLGDALIVALDAKHVGVDGPGTIDGRGPELRALQHPYVVRPFLLRWLRCQDVAVREVRLTNPGAWTLNFFRCRDITVERVTIRTRETGLPNNDGIDLDSCDGARVRDCDIESGDDALCLKATSPGACRDIVATGCRLSTRCNGIKLGTESLGDFEGIRISGCQLRKVGMSGVALYSVDGSDLHDVVVSDLTMDEVTVPISIRLGGRLRTFRPGQSPRPVGRLRDVTIRNVRVSGARQIGILVNGIPGHPVQNLTLENIEIALPGGGLPAQARVQLPEKVTAYPEYNMFGKTMPAYGIYVRHASGLRLERVRTTVSTPDARPERIFLSVEGDRTR